MNTQLSLAQEKCTEAIFDFYITNNDEIKNYKKRIVEEVKKAVAIYVKENNMPTSAVTTISRIKTIKSSLQKIKNKGYPSFIYLPDLLQDIVGIRIICWFLDDCFGIEKCIKQFEMFKIIATENYIEKPKKSGYRAIHITARLVDEKIVPNKRSIQIPNIASFNFEIQIQTKLQETWSEITHDYYLQSKNKEIISLIYQSFLERSAERLFNEDKLLSKIKIICQTNQDSI